MDIIKFRSLCKQIPNGCWIWIGGKFSNGYGAIWYKENNVGTHRYSLYLFKNFDLDSPLEVLHKPGICSERKSCVNPEHLYIGTQYENISDSIINKNHTSYKLAQRTHCHICGFELSGNNVYKVKGGKRRCRNCDRRRNAKSKAKKASNVQLAK